MAQLKDTVVSGSLRATDTIYSTTNQFQILKIPTSSNGTAYGVGDNGQILKSNGTSVYWANDNDTTNLTSMTGTLGLEHGGTGSATAEGARTNLGLGSLAIKSALIESDIPTLSIIEKTTGTLPISRGGTGEETDLDAITNLGSIYIKYGGTLISRNSNIDSDCKNPGTYYSPNQGTSETFTGNPPTISSGFKLITTRGYSDSVFHQFATINSEVLLYRFGKITNNVLQWADWRRFVLLPKTNEVFADIGSATQPVYVNSSGIITAGNALGSLAYKNSLVSSDIPDLSANKITSDTFDAARIPTLSIIDKTSGTLTVARGGTGATSFTANSVVISGNTTTSALTTTGTGTAGQYLISNGENNPPSWEELKIGGRNLLLDSRRERSATVATGATEASLNTILLSEYGAAQIKEGVELTASFDYEVNLETTTKGSIYTRFNSYSTSPARVISDVIAAPRGRASVTFTVTAAQAQYSSDFVFRVRITSSNEGATLKVWNVKLELGNQATDWTPAPEDFIETTNGIYYGVCSTAQATQAKEATLVNSANFSLEEGAMVAIKFTYASAESTMTLNVNGTGAKTLYQYGTTTMSSGTTTTGWSANSIVMFIYDGNAWFRQFWSNTTYTLNQLLSGSSTSGVNLEAETSANGGVGFHRYALEMMTPNGKWSAISCVSGSTASNQGTNVAKVAATANFLFDSPIMYTSTNTYVAPGSSAPMNGYTASSLNLRYSIGNTSDNVILEFQKPVYLVGIPNNDGATFKLDATGWWAQSLPATQDGKIYIYLGLAYSESSIYLNTYHPIYYHNGTNIAHYNPNTGLYASYDDTQSQYITHTNYNIIYNATTPSTRSDGTALQTGDIWLQPI